MEDPVTAYARSVCEGAIVAGPHVRAACRRHLQDLETGGARGLAWDLGAALRAIGFYRDVLVLNGGEFEGVPYELLPWQAFVIGSVFGWKGADGYRRFRVAYIETAKGSGKSPLAAGVGLYGLIADREPRAEIYAAATKRDQAMILFRDAVAMVDQSPELRRRIQKSGIGDKAYNLAWLEKGSFFRPISSDDGQSGPRPHIVLLDEVHEHRDGHVIQMLRAGTKGRRQALVFMITNSGKAKTSVCGEYHDYATKVAAGTIVDDAFFGYVCAVDEVDDPFTDPSCWIKANPSLGVTIQPKYLEEQVREARGMPSKEAVVRRLNFCQWVEGDDPWISGELWMRAREDFDPDALLGRRCWGGLDLSSTQDLTAFALLFEPTAEDPVWRQRTWFWLPGTGLADKADRDRVPYLAWRDAGWLEALPGRAVDKVAVAQRVVALAETYEIQAIAYDRWRIEDLKRILESEGAELPLVDFGQGYKDMSPAVEEYERRLVGDELKHDGNPVMTWCAANTVLESDHSGNRKPTKARSSGRIDGTVAAVMAAGVSLRDTEGSDYYAKGGALMVI